MGGIIGGRQEYFKDPITNKLKWNFLWNDNALLRHINCAGSKLGSKLGTQCSRSGNDVSGWVHDVAGKVHDVAGKVHDVSGCVHDVAG